MKNILIIFAFLIFSHLIPLSSFAYNQRLPTIRPSHSEAINKVFEGISSHIPISASSSKIPHLLFDATGAFGGFGDVVGVLNLMTDVKKALNGRCTITVLVDRKSTADSLTFYGVKNFSDLDRVSGTHFVPIEDSAKIKNVDYIFESFVSGRKIPNYIKPYKRLDFDLSKLDEILVSINPIENFEQLPFYDPTKTVLVLTDPMHGRITAELRYPGFSLFFKGPGIGPHRNGLFDVSDVTRGLIRSDGFAEKSLSYRQNVVKIFADAAKYRGLNRVILDQNIKLGFFYGVHNELRDSKLIGQTREYFNSIGKFGENSLLLSPNSPAEIEKSGIPKESIFSLVKGEIVNSRGEPPSSAHLSNQTIIVSVGRISGDQFAALMSLCTYPILVEGNNALSTAVRLRKPFVLYRSPWNHLNISDLIHLVDESIGFSLYQKVYLEPAAVQRFYNADSTSWSEIDPLIGTAKIGTFFENPLVEPFLTTLDVNIPNFGKKIVGAINLADQYEKALAEIAPTRIERVKQLIEKSIIFRDGALACSMAGEGVRQGLVPNLVLTETRRTVNSCTTFEATFNPYQPSLWGDIPSQIRPQVPSFSGIGTDKPHKIYTTTAVKKNIPHFVWSFWDKGMQQIPAFYRANIEMWEKILNKKSSGEKWVINVLDLDPSSENYVGRFIDLKEIPSLVELNEKIGDGLLANSNSPNKLSSTVVFSDFLRLELLYKFGGVWLDPSIMLHGPLTNTLNDIFSKKTREVAGYSSFHFGTEEINYADGLENFFIAALPRSELIAHWRFQFRRYWDLRSKGMLIGDHPMFNGSEGKSIDLSSYKLLRDYLNQHAVLKYVLTYHPALASSIEVISDVSSAKKGPFSLLDFAQWNDENLVQLDKEEQEHLVLKMNDVLISKFPSANSLAIMRAGKTPEYFYNENNIFGILNKLALRRWAD